MALPIFLKSDRKFIELYALKLQTLVDQGLILFPENNRMKEHHLINYFSNRKYDPLFYIFDYETKLQQFVVSNKWL